MSSVTATKEDTPTGSVGFLGVHDLGGLDSEGNIDIAPTHVYQEWERKIQACLGLLKASGTCTVDEFRRHIEALPQEEYNTAPYFGKWALSMSKILLRKEFLSMDDFVKYYGPPLAEQGHGDPEKFKVGDRVRVRGEFFATRWRKPHLRTPGYLFGKVGVIERKLGNISNPEIKAFVAVDTVAEQPTYRVRFNQLDLWTHFSGSDSDTVDVEVMQHWLLPADSPVEEGGDAAEGGSYKVEPHPAERQQCGGAEHDHDHDHDHDDGHHHHHHGEGDGGEEHGHTHEAREEVERTAVTREDARDGGTDDSRWEHLAESVVSACIDRGLVRAADLRKSIEAIEMMNKEWVAPKVVARAWVDEKYRKAVIEDASEAVKEFGVEMGGTRLVALENTATAHNVVVCTLCSCYPVPLLGNPPDWYKARSYRARLPRWPREVLKEFGVEIAAERAVRVHDSTSDLRYIVIPLRPAGTEGWSEERLRTIVTRDSCVGVGELVSQDS